MHGFKLVILVYLTTKCYSSKILGIMPTASYSHQIPFQPLWRELSLRGHQVTVLTTNPISDPHLTNLTEISLSFVYEFFEDVKFYQTLADDSLYFWERGVYLKDVSVRMAYLLLENEAVRSVFKEKFDLVIAEAHFPIVIGIAGNFICPWNCISSNKKTTGWSPDISKILGIMPTASYSHQIPFQPLWRELSLRGHQVTVLTTNPISDPHLTNLTEISLSFVYEFFEDVKFYQTLADDSLYFWERGVYLKDVSVRMAYLLLENEAVRSVFKEKFDLVIAEAHFPIVIGIAGNFRCPWIGISSMDPALHAHVALGNPSHPVLNPDPNLEVGDPDHPGFVERVLSFLYRNIYLFEFDKSLLPLLQRIHKDLVEDLLPLSEIQNNVSMLFVGTHPLFHNLRAVYPNTITLGCGMHFSQAKPLPEINRMLHWNHLSTVRVKVIIQASQLW